MNKNQIIKQAKAVLKNNVEFIAEIESHNDTASRLTHWETIESVDEYIDSIVLVVDGQVILSNEGTIDITGYYSDLLYGLSEAFEKKKLWVEPYNSGVFHISEDC